MKDLLDVALAGGYAVPSFCAWSGEVMEVVLRCARDLRSPVVLMQGPMEFYLHEPASLAAIARAMLERYPEVPAALHLDHGSSLDMVRTCLDGGYTSVMLDYSARPFAENVAALREVASRAHPQGVTVEGELGAVGRVDDSTREGTADCTLTDPAQAAQFVAQSGVDALAVSIGNAHGHYTRLPRLDFDRLAEIRRQVGVPLVLHGGSGTPDADLRRAIALGIAKVNVASDLVHAVRTSLVEQWHESEKKWTPEAIAVAYGRTEAVVRRWIERLGAAGKAGKGG